MIVFKDVCHAYKSGVKTLDHVSFRIDDGEFVFIVGPSGAGKSTLIKLLMAEERAQSGEIVVNNFRLDKLKRRHIPGEKQRVALARALINGPRMIIADEPTGNVDPVMSREIMELFSAINDQKITIVVVTHEKELVDTYNKRVITINHGVLVNDRKGGYDI